MHKGNGMEIEISLPDEVVRKVESLAIRLGITKSGLFCRAVLEYVKGCEAEFQYEYNADDRVREELDAVYTREDSGVDDVLAKMQWASLRREKC